MEGQLVITLKDGALSVQGPIENPLLCYALLEGARDAVFTKAQEAHRQRSGGIVQASGPISPFDPSRRNGS